MDAQKATGSRRPLKSRGTAWARGLTAILLRTGITPDQISFIGIGSALLGSAAVIAATSCAWLYLLAAAGIQGRLLCNMLDGLVAIEGGRKSPQGPLYNELPDRIEDSLLLIAFGYAADLLWLGLLAALLAAMTAYVRVLGGTFGYAQDFGGPMAKPHRMAALTVTALVAGVEAHYADSAFALDAGLLTIAAGTVWTIVRRTRRLALMLEEAA